MDFRLVCAQALSECQQLGCGLPWKRDINSTGLTGCSWRVRHQMHFSGSKQPTHTSRVPSKKVREAFEQTELWWGHGPGPQVASALKFGHSQWHLWDFSLESISRCSAKWQELEYLLKEIFQWRLNPLLCWHRDYSQSPCENQQNPWRSWELTGPHREHILVAAFKTDPSCCSEWHPEDLCWWCSSVCQSKWT